MPLMVTETSQRGESAETAAETAETTETAEKAENEIVNFSKSMKNESNEIMISGITPITVVPHDETIDSKEPSHICISEKNATKIAVDDMRSIISGNEGDDPVNFLKI